MARGRSSTSGSSRSSESDSDSSSDDASQSTIPNDSRALVPVANTSQALENLQAVWGLQGVNLATDIISGSFAYQPSTGSYTANYITNSERTTCPHCYQPFYNRAKMEEHRRDNTRPCHVCQNPTIWCCIGLAQARSMPCGYRSCAEHGMCFTSHKAAIEHAMARSHTSCFFPACADVMAIGPRNRVEVHNHMWYKHQPA
ncbi:hypothetical protein IQ06DRAFT_295782 [Phaeosphaeriaceae sp. SRC1lsM3a]|nr:hypothetical protein IQ06DRAFT_295782 [Stagonospora sp. SRC1lsM3a]